MDSQHISSSMTSDEISLRDIYLIIKRGFWFILLITIILAGLGFFYAVSRPARYESESTTSVTPSPISVQNTNGVSLSPRTSIPYESYERLAFSGVVLESVLKRFPDIDLNTSELQGLLSLKQVLGPSDRSPQSAQIVPLIVGHSVAYNDPERSAALTQTWSEETLALVKQTMSNNLTSVSEVTLEQRAQLRQVMDDAERNLREFRQANNLEFLNILFEQLNTRVAAQQLESNDLVRQISVARERQQRIAEQLESEQSKVTSSDPTSDAFLAGLSLDEARQTIEAQLALAENDFTNAQAALDTFEQGGAITIISTSIDNYQQNSAQLPFSLVETDSELAELASQRASVESSLRQAQAQVGSSDSLSDAFLAGLSLQEASDFLAKQLEFSQITLTRSQAALNTFDERHNLTVMDESIQKYEEDVAQTPFDLRENRENLVQEEAKAQLLREQISQLQQSLLSIDPSAAESFVGMSVAEAKALLEVQLESAQQQRQASQQALVAFDAEHNLSLLQEEISRYEVHVAELPFRLQEIDDTRTQQQAEQRLLEEQLAQEANKVTSSNPLSDTFLAGLSFEEGQSFLGRQLELAQENFAQARDALDAFDGSYNMQQLESEQSTLSEQVSSLPFRLDDIALNISIQENFAKLLAQQLEATRQRSASSNATSDDFLAGLSLSEAADAVALQVQAANEAQLASALALDSFDSEHDTALLQAQRDELRNRLVAKQSRYQELEGEISLRTQRLAKVQSQLSEQPALLALRDAVVNNNLLSEVSRQEGANAVLDYALVTERPNPVHTQLLQDALSHETQLDTLRNEQGILQEEIALRSAELAALSQDIVNLRRRRDGLQLQANQDAQRYAALLARSKQLQAALLDPRGTERVLTDESSLTNSIETKQREVAIQLEKLRSEQAGLTQRLQQAQTALPSLRQEIIDLRGQRERLAQRVQAQRSTLDNVQARVNTFSYNALDPRDNRQLRDTTPEVLALQANLRQATRSLASLDTRYTALAQQFSEAQARLPELRATALRLTEERYRLEVQADIATTLWNNLLIRQEQIASLSLDARGEQRILREQNLGNVELPSHRLERDLRDTERDIRRLREEATNLEARITEAERALPTLRNDHIRLAAERQLLVQRQEDALATFSAVEQRVDSFSRSGLDARTQRVLRNDTPEVLELQRQLATLNQDISVLQQRRRNFLARIELARQRLPELQAEFATLNLTQTNLLLARDQAQSTRDMLRARLQNFRYGALDNRQERRLRDSTPEVVELEKELRTAVIALRTLEQDLIGLRQQQEQDQMTLNETQVKRAEISEQQRQMETELESARVAYNEVVELEPTITYLTQVASVSAKILNDASVPVYPSNTSPIMVALLAGVVGGFMALVVVFIHSAIQDPETTKAEEVGDSLHSN